MAKGTDSHTLNLPPKTRAMRPLVTHLKGFHRTNHNQTLGKCQLWIKMTHKDSHFNTVLQTELVGFSSPIWMKTPRIQWNRVRRYCPVKILLAMWVVTLTRASFQAKQGFKFWVIAWNQEVSFNTIYMKDRPAVINLDKTSYKYCCRKYQKNLSNKQLRDSSGKQSVPRISE